METDILYHVAASLSVALLGAVLLGKNHRAEVRTRWRVVGGVLMTVGLGYALLLGYAINSVGLVGRGPLVTQEQNACLAYVQELAFGASGGRMNCQTIDAGQSLFSYEKGRSTRVPDGYRVTTMFCAPHKNVDVSAFGAVDKEDKLSRASYLASGCYYRMDCASKNIQGQVSDTKIMSIGTNTSLNINLPEKCFK